MESLINDIDNAAQEEAGAPVEDPGSIQDQIDAAENDGGTEALPGDHTKDDQSGQASPAKPPEVDGQQKEESLVDKVEDAKPHETEEVDETKPAEEVKPSEEETPEEIQAREAAALKADLLGTGETEPETDPIWKQRYDDQTQHYQELERNQRDKDAAQEKALKDLGWKMINTADGLRLTASEEAVAKTAEGVDIDGIVKNLTPKELKLFGLDEEEGGNPAEAAKLITSKLAQVFATKVPSITARPEDEVMTPLERDEIYDSFISEMLADGKTPRFPDCEKPDIKKDLSGVFAAKDPVMVALRNASERDPLLHRALLEFGYLRVFRANQGERAMAAARKQELEAKKQENKKDVSVGGTGGNKGGRSDGAGNQTETERVSSLYDDVHISSTR